MESSKAVKQGSDMGCSSSCQDYQESDFSLRERSWKCSPADLNVKVTTVWQENNRSSCRMFEVGNKLILNGPNKKLSLGGDEIFNRGSYLSAGVFEHNNRQKFARQTFTGKTKGLFGGKSPTMSPSSPPLEHMKISFQPIDGFETSKLKLKFRDGNGSCESSKDTFPMFQLVPEPSIAPYSVGLDSDDDTFYRSSPSESDDCLSHHSEINSELWESGESPCSKDHDLYDGLRRISLTDSVSTTLENGRTVQGEIPKNSTIGNDLEFSQPCLFDLPSFDSLNRSIKEEQRNYSIRNGLPELRFEPAPPPPPLPPMQWRAMNPYSGDVEDGPAAVSQSPNHVFVNN
ncbi:Protein SCAR3 [Abeliophyllum distichum]|uniref:Protein SCAR n=1 Tax=Abeliophyllum distichum TaxID=126358 RepID=A0ABD1VAG4_9LAMI